MYSGQMNNDEQYFQSYDQFQVHELMLRDRPRVTAYYDAIMNNKNLFENKVVKYVEIIYLMNDAFNLGCTRCWVRNRSIEHVRR